MHLPIQAGFTPVSTTSGTITPTTRPRYLSGQDSNSSGPDHSARIPNGTKDTEAPAQLPLGGRFRVWLFGLVHRLNDLPFASRRRCGRYLKLCAAIATASRKAEQAAARLQREALRR